jgi:hypothetical protein
LTSQGLIRTKKGDINPKKIQRHPLAPWGSVFENFNRFLKRRKKQTATYFGGKEVYTGLNRELKLQEYLKIPGTKKKETLNIFKWRTRMTPLGENYRGNQGHVLCPLCNNHLDNQPGLLQSEEMKKKI